MGMAVAVAEKGIGGMTAVVAPEFVEASQPMVNGSTVGPWRLSMTVPGGVWYASYPTRWGKMRCEVEGLDHVPSEQAWHVRWILEDGERWMTVANARYGSAALAFDNAPSLLLVALAKIERDFRSTLLAQMSSVCESVVSAANGVYDERSANRRRMWKKGTA